VVFKKRPQATIRPTRPICLIGPIRSLRRKTRPRRVIPAHAGIQLPSGIASNHISIPALPATTRSFNTHTQALHPETAHSHDIPNNLPALTNDRSLL